MKAVVAFAVMAALIVLRLILWATVGRIHGGRRKFYVSTLQIIVVVAAAIAYHLSGRQYGIVVLIVTSCAIVGLSLISVRPGHA